MLFNSYLFLFAFLPATVVIFFLLGRHHRRAAWIFLVLASLFFYAWWHPPFLALLLGSLAFNYGLGRAVAARSLPHAARKAALVFGITANLGVLGWYKYAGFLADTLRSVGVPVELAAIALPLGISFYTFQQIAYLVDAFRGETREPDPVAYALFVTFFPQLIAGPIVHHREMIPQFQSHCVPRPSSRDFSVGLAFLVLGLAKKVLIADNVAPWADSVYAAAHLGFVPSLADAWLGTLAFAFQIYFDFSGYSDMALGGARLFGIRLPLNFHSPYKAASIIDFWRRWHMTLSRFLRDYLYIPLGGNRRGTTRRYANVLVTMLLGGLWHGAGWTFVVWGGLHGLYLVVNHLWRAFRSPAGPAAGGPGRWLAHALTLLCILVAWVFFRADSLDSAGRILAGMCGAAGIGPARSVDLSVALPALLAILAGVLWLPATHELLERHEPALDFPRPDGEPPRFRWRPTPAWAFALAGLLVVSLLRLRDVAQFVYWQF